MIKKHIHILNGDSLNEQFPKEITGDHIIMRECFIVGPVDSNNLDDLFKIRAEFILNKYNDKKYYSKTVYELNKIKKLNQNLIVNLWFEHDLFCQINLWFVCYLLFKYTNIKEVYLIMPEKFDQYGFSELNESSLIQLFKRKIKLDQKKIIYLAKMWEYYSAGEHNKIVENANDFSEIFPFLTVVAHANKERFPENNILNRPEETILNIIKKIGKEEFQPVFREFCKKEYVYGFGDLQVKEIFNRIKKDLK